MESPVGRIQTMITKADRKRLQPHLSGWKHLNEILMLGSLNLDDLDKLLTLERTGQNRPFIVKKLVGRIHNIKRKAHLASCLNQRSKPLSAATLSRRGVSSSNSPRRARAVSLTAASSIRKGR